MSTKPCNDCIHCDKPFGAEPCSSCREWGRPACWTGFIPWRDELERLRAELERLQVALSAQNSDQPLLTDKQIPVLNDDGTLHNFTLKIGGKLYCCKCGCNVFHKPDRNNLDMYQCNGCESQFEAE